MKNFYIVYFYFIYFILNFWDSFTAPTIQEPSGGSGELSSFLSAILSSDSSVDFLNDNSIEKTKPPAAYSHHNAHRGVKIADRGKLAEALTDMEKMRENNFNNDVTSNHQF